MTDSQTSKESPPLHYLIPLFPCFQLLDLAGPLDMLNLLSMTPNSGLQNLTLTFVASTTDPVPTKPIPPKSGAYIFESSGISSTDTADGIQNRTFNQSIVPDFTFDEYLNRLDATNSNDSNDSQPPLRPIDVVLIPGGLGTRINRIYRDKTGEHNLPPVSNVADLISFMTKIHKHIRHSIITVCTGSDVLASTGLLNNRRATTNALRFDYVANRHPKVTWLRHRRWVKSSPEETTESDPTKFNGPIYTSAGISAGIDVMLSFIAETSSLELARKAAMSLEYDWTEIAEGEIDDMYLSEKWQEHLGVKSG